MVSGDLVGYKLSPQQRHLWRLQQDDPAQPYRAYCAVSIEGVIDRTALMRAMQALTDRHEILRVCFASLPGIAFPLQVVREFVAPSTTETDLCDLSLEQQNREIEAALDAAEQISFNLELGPLIRISLLRLSAGKYLALFLSPALCLDWVSLQNLMRDLGSCYSACLRGDAPVPPLALYTDVSEVFNDLLESPDTEMGRDFWTRPELSDPAGLRLPFEISQQERPEFVPRRFRFTPDATVAAGIAKLEREFETPGATFFLACWQLLLWRLSGQSDFSVGVGYDGRTYDELEAMLGLFARYLPLHVHCQGGDSFDGFLRQVDQSRREISRWQDYFSWGEKQKGWNNTRSSPFPLFCFEYLKEMKELSESGVKFTADRQCACFDRFRMKLSCIEAGGGLVAEIHYDAGFYTAEHVRELAGQYQRLLEAGIRGPQRAVGLLEIISEDEQRRVLLEFNSTTAEFPRSKCLHTLFEDQVERTPDNIAVFCGSERFSYRHLNQRANSLGHQLRAAGVGPEVLVAILMEHSVEMIIGLLAILKAGGAYVPLDPSYPPERTLFMLEGTGVLLSRRRLSAVIPAYRGRVLYAETDWQFAEVMENPVGGVQPDNLAYVIYTSGSTGRPKGAMLPHRGIVNCLWWMQAHYRLTESDRFFFRTSLSFDPSVWEVFWPLAVGASVVVAKPGTGANTADIIHTIVEHQITSIYFVPSLLRGVLEDPELESADSLVRVICGGESLPIEIFNRYFSRMKAELHHSYGPAECSIAATEWKCDPAAVDSIVHIGRPLSNIQIYILDMYLQPVPRGVTGELWIAGVALARGYLNRPDLTAERFIPSPFGTEPGLRMYRTGDLARYRCDGNIEYTGRIDEQIKIRGFRIELGEIQTVLCSHPAVEQTVVIAREERTGKQLVAYVAAKAAAADLSGEELKEFLGTCLPAFMIPANFVFLDVFPLTANGKVNRAALPSPEAIRMDRRFIPPQTDAEKILAELWSEVLGAGKIGIEDNFFELGGDSILSIQVVARAGRRGLHLKPKDLFDHQTIRDLAGVVGTAPAAQEDQGEVVGEVPLTPIQRWFFEQEFVELHHYNQSVLLRVREGVQKEHVERVVRELVKHHDALRLRYTRGAEGGWEQHNAGVTSEPDGLFTEIDLKEPGAEEQRAVLEETVNRVQASLDLERGPLVRVVLFELGAVGGMRLLIVVHHLAMDGVSWRILLEDLERGYEQARSGEAISFGAKTSSFRQWARRIEEYGSSGRMREEAGYWLGVAERSREVEKLPVDHKDGRNTMGSGEWVDVRFSAEQTQELLQEMPVRWRAEAKEVLVAALVKVLNRWTGKDRQLIEIEDHGREESIEGVDVTRTVGWFTAVYPVVVETERSAGLNEVMKVVKEELRGVPRRGVGYGVLRYMSGDAELREGLSRGEQPEVSFNYLGQFHQERAGAGVIEGEASERVGEVASRETRRRQKLLVGGAVVDGRLKMFWNYSREVHERATVEELARWYQEELEAALERSRQGEKPGLTPSDFPLAGLDQTTLDHLASGIEDIEDIYPLSPLQEGMLFRSQYDEDSREYFEQISCVIRNGFEVSALRSAWQKMIDRHSILRTGFSWKELQKPLQVIRAHATLQWEEHSWIGRAEDEKDLEVFLRADRERGFDLATPPLMRLTLIRFSEDASWLIWSIHHLVSDGWSLAALLSEVFASYDALLEGRKLALPPLRSYRDYIRWLLTRDLGRAEVFWRSTLKGFSSPTRIRAGLPGAGSGMQADYTKERLLLSSEVTADLQEMARRYRLTLNTIVQAGWALILSRRSGRSDVVFGATVSGRPSELKEVEQMVGPFINTLPVRVLVRKEERVSDWLQSLQAEQAAVREYEYAPLARVRQWSEIERGEALFESILVFENFPIDESLRRRSKRLQVEDVRSSLEGGSGCPILLVVVPGPEILLRIIYDQSCFHRGTIKLFLNQIRAVLTEIVATPEVRLGGLSFLNRGERALETAISDTSNRDSEQEFDFGVL